VAIPAGRYRLGPADGTLAVRTKRTGAAAMAGHNLLLHVGSWEATLLVGDETALAVIADGSSLRVEEGTGGLQALGDDDKQSIEQTIDDDVLKQQEIAFRSTSVEARDGGLAVQGELTLLGATGPLAFDVEAGDDGRVTATAVVTQTAFGMKPYSALFGALKVVDEVEVAIDALLPRSS
jgi:hypothetical protein